MLNFTFNSEQILAQFNGRFAFRAALDASPLPMETLHKLSTGESSALDPSFLRHEYLHWLVFKESTFGIETVGRRFRARSGFLRGNRSAVVDYYRQRTAYFCSAYDVHEKVVDYWDQSLSGATLAQVQATRLTQEQRRGVKAADENARAASRALGVHSGLTGKMIDLAKGYVATREYGLQCYIADAEGKVRLREISLLSGTQGVVNAAFETEIGIQNRPVRALKMMRRKLNTERRLGGLDQEAMGWWAALKFSAEFEALAELEAKGAHIPFDRSTHAAKTADFAFRHTLASDDPHLVGNLRDLIQACSGLKPADPALAEIAEILGRFEHDILYFLYVHGN